MAYQVDVTLQKVVCRNPESLTTGDRFVLSGAIVTDQSAKAFVTPIRVLRSNESFTYNEPVFSGFAETPTVGIAFTAWDKDLNTAWVTNEPEIREKEAEIEEAIGSAGILGSVAFSVLQSVATFVTGAIDVLVNHDLDDLLVDYSQWLQLEDVGPFAKHQRVHEVLFKRSDPTGYSDWDYSLFFVISHYQLSPTFPTVQPGWAEFRESSRPSRVSDWLGIWKSSPKEPRVQVDITPGATSELMNVHIVEQLPFTEFTLQREGVPISRVFIDTGHRELVTVGSPFRGESVSVPLNLGFAELVTQVNVVTMGGADYVSKTTINPSRLPTSGSQLGADYVPPPAINVIARQQVGTDIIWLGDIVIEAYKLVFGRGAPEGVVLRYMRPVTNVLYREVGAEVVLPLDVQFEF